MCRHLCQPPFFLLLLLLLVLLCCSSSSTSSSSYISPLALSHLFLLPPLPTLCFPLEGVIFRPSGPLFMFSLFLFNYPSSPFSSTSFLFFLFHYDPLLSFSQTTPLPRSTSFLFFLFHYDPLLFFITNHPFSYYQLPIYSVISSKTEIYDTRLCRFKWCLIQNL